MPFDPFFSSAYKKHHITRPGTGVLRAKVRAMSQEAKQQWFDEMKKKRAQDRSYEETLAMNDLLFYWGVQGSARRKTGAERIANDLNILSDKHGVRVLSGLGTTGHLNMAPRGSYHHRPSLPAKSLNRDFRSKMESLARYKERKNRQPTK